MKFFFNLEVIAASGSSFECGASGSVFQQENGGPNKRMRLDGVMATSSKCFCFIMVSICSCIG